MNWPYFWLRAGRRRAAPAPARAIGKRAAIATSIARAPDGAAALALRCSVVPGQRQQALFWTLMFFYPLEVVLIVMSTALVSAMVADVVEESELATGRRSEGVFFAARSFAHKSVSGFGLFLATLLLGVVGFPEGASSPSDVDPAVIRRLAGIYIAFIVLAYGLSIAFYARYRINRAGHEDNLRKLAERAPARA
jgi:Na+/melibiose symporter-like transporter